MLADTLKIYWMRQGWSEDHLGSYQKYKNKKTIILWLRMRVVNGLRTGSILNIFKTNGFVVMDSVKECERRCLQGFGLFRCKDEVAIN